MTPLKKGAKKPARPRRKSSGRPAGRMGLFEVRKAGAKASWLSMVLGGLAEGARDVLNGWRLLPGTVEFHWIVVIVCAAFSLIFLQRLFSLIASDNTGRR